MKRVSLLAARSVSTAMADVLEQMLGRNTPAAAKRTLFDGACPPAMGVRTYLERIIQYVKCSGESLVMALVYIDRLIEKGAFMLTKHNAHRLLITCVLVAAKLFDDEYYSNAVFAKVGGVSVIELNKLELELLYLLQFSTHVSTHEYGQYYRRIVSRTKECGSSTNSSSSSCCTFATINSTSCNSHIGKRPLDRTVSPPGTPRTKSINPTGCIASACETDRAAKRICMQHAGSRELQLQS